jgi:hypothetical protein
MVGGFVTVYDNRFDWLAPPPPGLAVMPAGKGLEGAC